MPERADRYPEVDALRALAAIAVLGTHAAIFAGADYPGSDVGRYAQRLEVGLTIFFVISGFLLYRPFVAARLRQREGPRTAAYAWRRLLRIAPAYWVALILSAVLVGKDEVFSSNAPYFFLLGQTYSGETLSGGLTQAWTLCVEIAFYAFLPVWAWATDRLVGRSLRAEALTLGGLVLLSLGYKVLILSGTDPRQVEITPLLIALPAYLDQFALGMGLAVLTVHLQQRERAAPAAVRVIDRWPALPWLVAIVAFWAVATRIGIGDALFEPFTPAQYLGRHYLYALIGVAVVVPAVIGTPGRGLVRRALANRWAAWLGLVSYGIYLWHFTTLTLLERAGFGGDEQLHPYIAWPLAGLATAVVAAAASWYLIERPALTLKRLVPGARTRIAPLPAAPEPQPAARIADPS
jgi:peptidoglycan/LPS O-acetylase OafA/YrhL